MRTRAALLVVLLGGSWASAQTFPLRAKYPHLDPITTEELAHGIGESLVVDVRSRFEYTVMHIEGASHLDLSAPDFLGKLAAATGDDKSKSIVTYCNGTTCEKSYEAAELAQKAGFTRVRVYDGGIVEWLRMARGRTLLFGQPVKPEEIIPETQFRARLLKGREFQGGAAEPGALLIDVRDARQRARTADFARSAQKLTVDELVKTLATQAFRSRTQGKTLYIFDNVGKQVRWVQYALRAHDYDRYFFLDGGMASLTGEP
jgi:rhodanese-related sulfurtransferase